MTYWKPYKPYPGENVFAIWRAGTNNGLIDDPVEREIADLKDKIHWYRNFPLQQSYYSNIDQLRDNNRLLKLITLQKEKKRLENLIDGKEMKSENMSIDKSTHINTTINGDNHAPINNIIGDDNQIENEKPNIWDNIVGFIIGLINPILQFFK